VFAKGGACYRRDNTNHRNDGCEAEVITNNNGLAADRLPWWGVSAAFVVGELLTLNIQFVNKKLTEVDILHLWDEYANK